MSEKTNNRFKFTNFIDAVLTSVLIFIVLSVVYKLFLHRETWLIGSLPWAISWGVGKLCAYISKVDKWYDTSEFIIVVAYIIIGIMLFFIVAFITGVVLNLANWSFWTMETVIPFMVGFIITNHKKQ